MARRSLRIVGVAAGLAALPAVAQAHLVVTGMGPIYDGVTHFSLNPEDSIPVVALAFFAGLRGPSTARLLLAALPFAWLAGGLIALCGAAAPATALSIATAVAFLAIGGLLATNVALPPPAVAAVAVGLGLMRGFADLSETVLSGGHLLTLAGMSASVFVVFALAASLTLPLKRFWMIVAVRVGGSWLAALGLLLAGWVWRYGARAF
jgi:hydrogenase/urease accessory protein HupE